MDEPAWPDQNRHDPLLLGCVCIELHYPMNPLITLRRSLILSGAVMLVGVLMLIAPQAFAWAPPLWWRRAAALVILIGALAEIVAVWRFFRQR